MISISSYNPDWQRFFVDFYDFYNALLSEHILGIEHVGSTSVPGLAAKPILDIDIVIENESKLAPVLDLLQGVGYRHLGELGIKGRFALRATAPHLPFAGAYSHHLYVCLQGCQSLENHLLLRNYLLENPEAVAQYTALKTRLAADFSEDLDAYVEGKTAFIVDVLARCGMDANKLADIVEANKKP